MFSWNERTKLEAEVVLADLSASRLTSPISFTNWRMNTLNNKTNEELKQAISDLRENEDNAKRLAAKAAKRVVDAVEEHGTDNVVVCSDGSVDLEKAAKKAKRKAKPQKMAEKMKARLGDAKAKRGRPSLLAESEFRKFWENAESMDSLVAHLVTLKPFASQERTQIKLYASMRASALRKKGINLKRFSRGRKALKG